MATTPTYPEQDPILIATYSPTEIVGQTYTGLRDLTADNASGDIIPLVQGWLFGLYRGI